MEITDHFVEFDKYCDTCIYKETKQDEEPCTTCLTETVNTNSRKPVNYEADEDLVAAKEKAEKKKEEKDKKE